MKYLMVLIAVLIFFLQYRLLSAGGTLQEIRQYDQQIEHLQQDVSQKKQRNQAIYAEVLDLRKGQDALEERARYELGMIKEGETFFQIIE